MTAGLTQAAAIVRRGLVLSGIGLLALGGVYVLALGHTPLEARQGLAQKIFYLHVPAAWSALLSFSLVGAICALARLATRRRGEGCKAPTPLLAGRFPARTQVCVSQRFAEASKTETSGS